MNIEIEGDTKYLEVIESAIRNTVSEDSQENEKSTPHFQARIIIDKEAKDHIYDCIISYYNDDGVFLGISETNSCKKRSITGEPRSISSPIDIPENTAKVVARFARKNNNEELWFKLLKTVGTVLILMLIVTWVIGSIKSVFS